MSEKNKAVPTLRFPGFSGGWEESKLGEILTLLKDGTHGTHKDVNEGVYLLSAKNIKNGQILIDKTDRKISEKEYKAIHKNFSLEKGDVLLTVVGSIGECAILDNPVGITFQRSVAYLRPSDKVISKFLYTTINSGRFQCELKKRQVVSAQPGIYLGNLSVIPIQTPSVDEQTKIGAFFAQLDTLITLHQRKLGHLQDRKKALLQQLFPKNGKSVPQLRFPGFSGDWVERKLGELANIVRGASPRPIQNPKWFDDKSDIGWLRIADVTEQNGRIHHLKQKISEAGQEKTRVLTQPHLLLSIAATVGKPVVNYVKTGVHDGFLIFLNPKFDQEFMFQWLVMFRINWKKYGQPGSQVNLNSALVKNQEVLLPHEDEQQIIGEFFKHIDDSITLQQRKLTHLQDQKKALLQQLFI